MVASVIVGKTGYKLA